MQSARLYPRDSIAYRSLEKSVPKGRLPRLGGRLLVLDFGKPENALWRTIYFGYLRLFVPLLGLVVCGSASAYAYILESLKNYPAQQGVAEAMTQLGLEDVRIVRFFGGVMTIKYGRKGG